MMICQLFAQSVPIPDAESLATKGTPYVLAICVIALSAALIYVFRLYRSDMREKRGEFLVEVNVLAKQHEEAESRWRGDMMSQRAEFMTALRDQRTEFHVALKEVVADMRAGMKEIKDATNGMSERLARVEDSLDGSPAR